MGNNYNDPYANYGNPNPNYNSAQMQQMGNQNFQPAKVTETL